MPAPIKREKAVKILKAPPALEEFLFENPDYAISFNNLPPSDKNEWILAFKNARTPASQQKTLEKLKSKLVV